LEMEGYFTDLTSHHEKYVTVFVNID